LFIYFTSVLASVPVGTEEINKVMANTEKGHGNGVICFSLDNGVLAKLKDSKTFLKV